MARLTPEQKIIEQLDALAQLRKEAAELDENIRVETEDAIPASLRTKIDKLKSSRENLGDAMGNLEADIKRCILIRGESLKATALHAIWAKGRETWDSKGLAGYALTHPEILSLKKVGEPSVSIREVKGGE